ncbi:kinase [Ectothiorhodospiraceae bacterium BW-2]|nr:kinase [Ectothiorhodospiraceae bacterium BW-2]
MIDPQGQQRQLDSELARGGEGSIYPLQDRPEVLIKLYHPEVLQKRGALLQQKVEQMTTLATTLPDSLSWPKLSVFHPNHPDRWLGYAMRRMEGKPMKLMAHAVAYRKHFPGLDRIAMVNYLLQLLKLLDELHQKQIFIGDYNLNNILCQPGSNRVGLIDCDSYQVSLNGKHYPCPVGSPDMTPVEHHGQSFEQLVRTPESERFSVAMILFKALMLGRHPYDIVGGDDPVTNLKRGNFPYGKGKYGIPEGHWYNIWSHMPHKLKSMFISTFTDGVHDPALRPTLQQWHDELKLYRKNMQRDWHDTRVIPPEPKSSEYRGNRSDISRESC